MALITRKIISVTYNVTLQKLADTLFYFKDAKFPIPVGRQGKSLLYDDQEIARWFEKNDIHGFKKPQLGKTGIKLNGDMMMRFISGKFDPEYKQEEYAEKLQSISGLRRKTTTQRIGIEI